MNSQINQHLKAASEKIAPAWPLKTVVAVNPYLGISEQNFTAASHYLDKVGGVQTTMPLPFYIDQIDQGVITRSHLEKALESHQMGWKEVGDFIAEAKQLSLAGDPPKQRVQFILDLATDLTQIRWKVFMVNQLSLWAGSYFDEDQSTWKSTTFNQGLFSSWKLDAEKDRSPEIMGLTDFRSIIKTLPNDHQAACEVILSELDLPQGGMETYLHGLLMRTIGWSSFLRGIDWDKNVYGQESQELQEWLAVLLCWEYVGMKTFSSKGIRGQWEKVKPVFADLSKGFDEDQNLSTRLVLQEAYEQSAQQELQEKFQNAPKKAVQTAAKFEAVFCIDVRSEVYRRNLESCSPDIDTSGFAGFFGFPISYKPLGSDKVQNQCPVLLPSSLEVHQEMASKTDQASAIESRVASLQVNKIWKRFKTSAVASFGFVSPLGINYLPKLITDSFGWTSPAENPHTAGLGKYAKAINRINTDHITLEQKIATAANALIGMGMKDKQAPLVLLAGHGSTTVNNPHGSGLDCGACGGQAGEANARVAANVLNEPAVRKGLKEKGIEVSTNTYFIAGLHNTTTDELSLFDEDLVPESHSGLLAELKTLLNKAGALTRMERAPRLKLNPDEAQSGILSRSKDWSTVRPEWGLSGCNAFVIAPRERTANVNLEGRSFLHNYTWSSDEEFKLLEAIMTAPMVVTSWINLQYYGSTVDPRRLGGGDKTLHNVTAGKGVLEGATGDLRMGLPWQSIHDGDRYQHLPQRLNVIIEAPIQAINKILQTHENLKQLFDNRWISLLHLNEAGLIDQRYTGNLQWESMNAVKQPAQDQKVITSKPVYDENL